MDRAHHGMGFLIARRCAWRGVAWRGVAWRGVAWRGVAWRVCVVVVLGGGDRPALPVQLKCGASGAHAGVHAVERTLPHDCTEELVLRPDDRLALDVGAWLCDAVGIAEHIQVGRFGRLSVPAHRVRAWTDWCSKLSCSAAYGSLGLPRSAAAAAAAGHVV